MNIIEAMKMSVGTEFHINYKDGSSPTANIFIKGDNDNGDTDAKYLQWSDGDDVLMRYLILNAEFTPYQKAVSFMDVLNSTNQCRIEYTDEFGDKCEIEFDTFDFVMHNLADDYNAKDLRRIITTGKWYLDESGDN